jgi:sulfite dehydrogenase (cytochrome) subunit B
LRRPNINFKHLLTAVVAAMSLGAAALAQAGAKSMVLPPDGVVLKESSLPGYAKAQAVCAICHSAEYLQYQPPTAARPYWGAMVKRMKMVFKAPIADADISLIVDYLVKTYGNEQAK